jgi:uncharacterized protein YjbI with pentapeptide repeats
MTAGPPIDPRHGTPESLLASGTGSQQQRLEEDPLSRQKDNIAQLSEISRNSRTHFFAIILACVYSFLTIATTTDAALLSNSSATPLPIIQVNVPIVWFYYFAPIILGVLFVYFHLYLERFWRCIARLPLRHPDGRGLDDYIYPWLISSAFIRGEIRELTTHRVSARLEALLSLLLSWWLVPIVLMFYWARYLVAHDWLGTSLHLALILLTFGFSLRFWFTARNALKRMAHGNTDGGQEVDADLKLGRRQTKLGVAGLAALAVAFVYLSASAIHGLPGEVCRNLDATAGCGFYGPGHRAWNLIGVEPNLQVEEERFIPKPGDWQRLLADEQAVRSHLEVQQAPVLLRRNLRAMSANSAFLPGSRIVGGVLDYAKLQHAALTGSRLEEVDFVGADLTDADLQYANIVNVRFEDVFAPAARFDHARFIGATSETRTRFSGDFSGASFRSARGDELRFGSNSGATSLREASLAEASITWSRFHDVDLSGADLRDATLTHNDFFDTDFSRANIVDTVMNYSKFHRCSFISVTIEGSLLEEATFVESVFDHAPLGVGLPDTSDSAFSRVPRKLISGLLGSRVAFVERTKIRNVEFTRADLRNARFEEAMFENVLFTESDLSGAIFENVDLTHVEFEQVDLSGAELSRARIPEKLLDGACGNEETRLPPGFSIKPCLVAGR